MTTDADTRDAIRQRIHTEPHVHAIAHVLRTVLAVADDDHATTAERDDAVLDGTAAILAVMAAGVIR